MFITEKDFSELPVFSDVSNLVHLDKLTSTRSITVHTIKR